MIRRDPFTDRGSPEKRMEVKSAVWIFGVADPTSDRYTFPFNGERKSFRALALGIRFADMRFHLIDRILELEPGKRIRMVKNLTLAEEYLADHFPTFPVMPGVLMLQTLVEGAAWLLRATEDFQHSVIVLRDARNVKYGNFMQPGNSMTITVEAVEYSPDAPNAVFKGKAEMAGSSTVSA